MSNKPIDYRIVLKRDGQTQQQRMPQWLKPSAVPVDGRNADDLFKYLKKIAENVKFYDADMLAEAGTWQDFFDISETELDELIQRSALPPHIALCKAFINLYQLPRQLMNTITQRHLDFYYGEVLKLHKNPPTPDNAHVVFELKKNTAVTLIKAGANLLAGKDAIKKDLRYQLSHDIVVNASVVAQLKSLYVDRLNKNYIHYAPIANSADGLGAEIDPDNPKWPAFGFKGLPLAQLGFCLASDILKMQEGDRTVTISLTLTNLSPDALNSVLTTNLFRISITSEKGWIGPKTVSATVTRFNNTAHILKFVFGIAKDEPSVTAYNAEVHGGSFVTVHPVLQVLLNNEKADFGYKDLAAAALIDATIEVDVKGLKALQLSNDLGTLDAAKPFTPFGATPDKNANFTIGSDEAFTKRLKEFSFEVEWKNIPESNLATYYKNYGTGYSNTYFTANAGFKDGFGWEDKNGVVTLFNTSNAQSVSNWKFTNPAFGIKPQAMVFPTFQMQVSQFAGQPLQQKITSQVASLMPSFASLQSTSTASVKPLNGPAVATSASVLLSQVQYFPIYYYYNSIASSYRDIRTGSFNLRLNKSFLFKEFTSKYTEEVLRYSKLGGTQNLPNEPFAPEIQSISLNYIATTAKTGFSGLTLNDYVDEEVELFHYGAFGQMREHAYVKNQQTFLKNTLVNLLPEYRNEGEFFIGLSGLSAQDSASILFQVAEGSANPDKPKVNVNWSVLCDNYWKELTNEDFIFDTTNGLLTSGVIKLVIPREATTINTLMPNGLLWIRAYLKTDSDAVCQLADVKANAAIVRFSDDGNDLNHLAQPLPAQTITKLEQDVGAIKSVKQPYPSFGGRMLETDETYYIRVAERLRHKERSISNWDYERLILQHFPAVHKVKCINHANGASFYMPGHVLIIVVPDLTNQNAADPLRPKADKNTLDSIHTFLKNHSTDWITHHVANPYYEPVKISVRIKLKSGFEFNYYEKIIASRLQEFLSPWIANTDSSVHFGGKISQSRIVQFLEEMEFVDFISDLKLFHSVNGGKSFGSNTQLIEASNPAAVLVSHSSHQIFHY